MPELNSRQAGEVVGTSDETIRRYVNLGLLPARQQGVRKLIRIEITDLEQFAEEYGFRFDRSLADQLSS